MPADENVRIKIEGLEFVTSADIEMMGLQLLRGNGKPVLSRTMQKQRQFFQITDHEAASGYIVKGRQGGQRIGKPCYLVEA